MKKSLLVTLLLSSLGSALFAEKTKAPQINPVTAAAVEVASNTSLLKVNVTIQPWNQRIPWQKSSPTSRRGLGVLLEGNHILVTAQMVADATYIELEKADTGLRLPAKVMAVDYDANLALLEPAQPGDGFFSGLKPMAVETNARIGDALQVWQLDRAGELILTPVIINKILTSRYVLETSFFLVYEAIGIIRTEANSFTLPVIKNGKLAGLLLSYDSKNQSASVLPGPIIAHFLKDMQDAIYQGFPSLGVEYQQTLDEQFREYLGMTKGQNGVYVSNVATGGSAENIGVKEGDIILEMNGHPVDARGDYKDAQFGRLNMSHIVRGQSFVGDTVKIKVLRDRQELTLSGKLTRKAAKDFVVPPYLFDKGSNFFVMGGLIFQELSLPYLQSFGADWESSAPLRLTFIAKHTEEYEKQGRKKIVFLAGALPTRSTQGYERLGGLIVTQVNGKPINDLNDLDGAFKAPQDGLHKIEFEEVPKVIWLDTTMAESDNTQLLSGAYRLGALKRIE